jgi:hypothetical protein
MAAAMVCMVTVGLPAAPRLPMTTLFQLGSADSIRGRVFGALLAVQGCAMLAGTLLAGHSAAWSARTGDRRAGAGCVVAVLVISGLCPTGQQPVMQAAAPSTA